MCDSGEGCVKGELAGPAEGNMRSCLMYNQRQWTVRHHYYLSAVLEHSQLYQRTQLLDIKHTINIDLLSPEHLYMGL